MTINNRWIWMLAACGAVAAFTAQVRRKREVETRTHKADLREWENEGGNLAPASGAHPATEMNRAN
jgi:hypothetical protein